MRVDRREAIRDVRIHSLTRIIKLSRTENLWDWQLRLSGKSGVADGSLMRSRPFPLRFLKVQGC